jgi:DNA (cytosine-5)-methyltransferase 1
MEGGQLDAAPIWSDLKSFPWKEFSGLVDILSGGYPCQPFSAAGKRLGTEDPRHLWPYIAEGIRLLRPRICFFENVEGHISLGLREVIGELEELGYQTTFGIFSASECGAPHQRKRVFILAVSSGFRGSPGLSGQISGYEGQSGELNDGGGEIMADAQLHGCNHAEQRPHADGVQGSLGKGNEHRQALRDGEVMADSECSRSSTGRSDARRQEVSQSEHCNLWPSRPGEQQYSWEPPRVTQPPLGGNPDGPAGGMDYAQLCVTCDNRTDELRLLGNGVVPATAERAFRTLISELFPQ